MTHKITYTLIVLVLALQVGKSQPVDTCLVLKHLKIRLFTEMRLGILSESALYDYYKRELKATVLESRGFEGYIFFKISSQVLAADTIKENKTIAIYSTPTCLKNGEECYFVYAYNKKNNSFYKLRGTRDNDFEILYDELQDKWMYWKPLKRCSPNPCASAQLTS